MRLEDKRAPTTEAASKLNDDEFEVECPNLGF